MLLGSATPSSLASPPKIRQLEGMNWNGPTARSQIGVAVPRAVVGIGDGGRAVGAVERDADDGWSYGAVRSDRATAVAAVVGLDLADPGHDRPGQALALASFDDEQGEQCGRDVVDRIVRGVRDRDRRRGAAGSACRDGDEPDENNRPGEQNHDDGAADDGDQLHDLGPVVFIATQGTSTGPAGDIAPRGLARREKSRSAMSQVGRWDVPWVA